ncbi:telomerase inhibitor [Plenodomus lindquistii]|nr:telomerase inhibitor [Plenodomus lindquistii]
MGLAAPKNRSKISNDPNNTTWANNTSRFGHRILEKQGWQQGEHLGAKDASHSAHYTAASASHIRVFLKDDNLGLGAKRGSERAENFGLAGLESILGRLNGNEAEVKKEEERREEIEKRAFVYRKYGMMNFVSGGLLVGDKIVSKADLKEEPEVKVEIKKEPESDDDSAVKKEKKDKKRKRLEVEAVEVRTEEPKLKRKKKSLDLREEAVEDETAISKKDKKTKKDKNKKAKKSSSDSEDVPSPASDPEALTDKARRKAEKKARKEEKKLKKALKKAAKAAKKSKNESDDSSSDSEDESTPSSSLPATGASTPAISTAGLTYTPRGMHAVRQRWIRQKKAATMDAQAMKEIFMIKTPS